MPMALHDDVLREDLASARPGAEHHFLGTQAHGRALVGLLGALLGTASQILPFGDHRNDRMRRGTVEFRAVRVRQTQHVATVLDDRNLHAETDAEIRHTLLARIAHSLDLALDAALAEAARHENRIHALERMSSMLLDVGGLDVVNVHARAALQAAMHERLMQRQIGVADLHVLADHRNVDLAIRIRLGAHHLAPLGEIRRRHLEAQLVHHDVIQLLLAIQQRDLVDVIRIDRGNDRTFFDVGEQRDLAALLFRQRMFAPAQQDVRLNTDAAQLLHGVLGRLRLDLIRATDNRHQREVHI